MSLPSDLSDRTLDTIVSHFGLEEHRGVDGGPYRTLVSPMQEAPVGAVRIFTGPGVAKVVCVGLAVEALKLDTHMIFAFTPESSAVPHFTLDSVFANDVFAFHLDLIPRAELAPHLDYVRHVYGPLTTTFEETREIPGLSRAQIGPLQYALMSPWMCVYRADEPAFRKIEGAIQAYVQHWAALVDEGLPDAVLATLADTDLGTRDAAHRANIFNPEVDPVWNQVVRLVGAEAVDDIRRVLKSNDVPAP